MLKIKKHKNRKWKWEKTKESDKGRESWKYKLTKIQKT